MADAVRFEDLVPDDKSAFLSEARARHANLHQSAAAFDISVPHLSPGWGCGNCGWAYPLKDVLIDNGEPQCPHCETSGWLYVIPRDEAINSGLAPD
ncbi:MAG: hypothetical protein ACLQRH_21395 [Acidimicrobiales bacterium]